MASPAGAMGGPSSEGETLSNVQQRVLNILNKNHKTGTSLDPDALNLVTSPEYKNLRGNIINHLKRTLVKDDAEGKAGRDPEESIGTGKRSQIRFKPIVMRSTSKSITKTNRRRILGMMNRGRGKLGSVTISNEKKTNDPSFTPLAQGLDKAVRSKFRTRPEKLRNPRRVEFAKEKRSDQFGLQERSRKNFNDKTKARRRRKLDVSFN